MSSISLPLPEKPKYVSPPLSKIPDYKPNSLDLQRSSASRPSSILLNGPYGADKSQKSKSSTIKKAKNAFSRSVRKFLGLKPKQSFLLPYEYKGVHRSISSRPQRRQPAIKTTMAVRPEIFLTGPTLRGRNSAHRVHSYAGTGSARRAHKTIVRFQHPVVTTSARGRTLSEATLPSKYDDANAENDEEGEFARPRAQSTDSVRPTLIVPDQFNDELEIHSGSGAPKLTSTSEPTLQIAIEIVSTVRPKSIFRRISQSVTASGFRETYDEFKERLDGHTRRADRRPPLLIHERPPSPRALGLIEKPEPSPPLVPESITNTKIGVDDIDETEKQRHRRATLTMLEGGPPQSHYPIDDENDSETGYGDMSTVLATKVPLPESIVEEASQALAVGIPLPASPVSVEYQDPVDVALPDSPVDYVEENDDNLSEDLIELDSLASLPRTLFYMASAAERDSVVSLLDESPTEPFFDGTSNASASWTPEKPKYVLAMVPVGELPDSAVPVRQNSRLLRRPHTYAAPSSADQVYKAYHPSLQNLMRHDTATVSISKTSEKKQGKMPIRPKAQTSGSDHTDSKALFHRERYYKNRGWPGMKPKVVVEVVDYPLPSPAETSYILPPSPPDSPVIPPILQAEHKIVERSSPNFSRVRSPVLRLTSVRLHPDSKIPVRYTMNDASYPHLVQQTTAKYTVEAKYQRRSINVVEAKYLRDLEKKAKNPTRHTMASRPANDDKQAKTMSWQQRQKKRVDVQDQRDMHSA